MTSTALDIRVRCITAAMWNEDIWSNFSVIARGAAPLHASMRVWVGGLALTLVGSPRKFSRRAFLGLR